MELDDTLAEAHAASAALSFHFGWDWASAEKGFRRAIELNPNLVMAHMGYGEFLLRVGRFAESITENKRAQELDPVSLSVNTQLGWSYSAARQHEKATRQFQMVLELDPNFALARFNLGEAYELAGRYEEAIRELQRALAADKDNWAFLALLGYTYGMAGKRQEALSVFAQLRKQAASEYVSPFAFAIFYLGAHENENALTALEKAYEERDVWLITIKASPELDPLRSDPRFQNLLHRMNFPP